MNTFYRQRKYCSCLFFILLWVSANAGAISPDNSLLQIIQTMQEGTWTKVNTNTFKSVWTPIMDRQFTNQYGNGINGVISAYSAFAWDSNRSQLIIYGGGHATYGGNDVYMWRSSTLQWVRASLPSKLQNLGASYFLTVDNGVTPISSHNYDNNVFLPNIDRFLTFGGASFNAGKPFLKVNDSGKFVRTGPYLFNPGRADGDKVGGANGTGVNPYGLGGNMWQNRDIYANINGATLGTTLPYDFIDGMADVTKEDGKDVVYVVGRIETTQYLYRYQINDVNNPSLDSWTVVGVPNLKAISGGGTAAYDPVNKIFVRTGFESWPFLFWDIKKASRANRLQTFTPLDYTNGVLKAKELRHMGFGYEPNSGTFLIWGGGNRVYRLTEPQGSDFTVGWTVTIDNPGVNYGPGGLGVNDNDIPGMLAGGVLGKWHYAPDLRVFVGLKDQYNGNVWIYKPNGWTNPLLN